MRSSPRARRAASAARSRRPPAEAAPVAALSTSIEVLPPTVYVPRERRQRPAHEPGGRRLHGQDGHRRRRRDAEPDRPARARQLQALAGDRGLQRRPGSDQAAPRHDPQAAAARRSRAGRRGRAVERHRSGRGAAGGPRGGSARRELRRAPGRRPGLDRPARARQLQALEGDRGPQPGPRPRAAAGRRALDPALAHGRDGRQESRPEPAKATAKSPTKSTGTQVAKAGAPAAQGGWSSSAAGSKVR